MSSIIMPRGIIKPPDLVGYWPLNGEKTSGINLFDPGKGDYESTIEGWQAQGTNTVAVSTEKAYTGVQSVKITYGNSQYGAILYCTAAGDLTTNLTIGKKYRARAWAAVSAGASVDCLIFDGVGGQGSTTITSETMVEVVIDFIALHATGCYWVFDNMGAGESIYIDTLSIEELYTPDISGLGIHGTITGGVTPSALGGYDFDGVAGSFIDLGPNAGDYTDNFTLMALINVSTPLNERVASRRDDTNTQWDWFLYNPQNDISIYDGATSHRGSVDVGDGLDHWVTTVINGANSQHFVDGKKDGAAFSPSITSYSLNTMLGAWGSTGQQSNWPGAVRKFFIYNRALTEPQIHYEMYRGSPFKPVFRGGVLWPR